MSAELVLNPDQQSALAKIEAAEEPGTRFLLTGFAGSGKTTLLQRFASNAQRRGRRIVLTAPTHKAVSVLRRKLVQAGVEGVDCRTIHSLLSLRPRSHGDRRVFERDSRAEPVLADIVVIDECSMIDEQMFRHIKRYLPVSFVLFVGDPAQLPPVGEAESLTFGTRRRAHLNTIVRQASDNPILKTAGIIRESQGKNADWSWCAKSTLDSGHGVFMPNGNVYRWMEKAFTSEAFDKDPDSFRYLAWTNKRVDEVNRLVRRWRYGESIPTPFMPGERAMFRAPVIIDGTLLFSTNEEATIVSIEPHLITHRVSSGLGLSSWTANVQVWRTVLRDESGAQKSVNLPRNELEFGRVLDRFRDEAAEDRSRWKQMHDFESSFARMQAPYALTVHCSQGSTFLSAFVDVPDIRRRQGTNLLECQQLCYVAVTRASERVMLIAP